MFEACNCLARGRFVRWLLAWALVPTGLYAREVMSWVPPYAVDECRTTLQSDFGAFSPSNVLNRIGLQFWIPTTDGGAVKTTEYGEIADSDIAWFRNWGAANGAEVLLCVYNNVGGVWDWDLAVSAFVGNRSAFVSNLVAAVDSHELDGIDVDIEGLVTPGQDDRAGFLLFLEELSAELKQRGKLLTVDSFHSPLYNAPNMSWWVDWTNLVDSVHTMGYTDLYEGSTVTLGGVDGYLFRYSWQQDYGVGEARLAPEAVSMGLPGWLSAWGAGGRGSNVLDHINECIHDCAVPASVCIWDLQLTGTSGATNWHSSEVWEALAGIAGHVSFPLDGDGDGMADEWEIRHFGGTNVVNGEASDDRDEDRYSNLEEYVAGTDPTNRSSALSLSIQEEAGGSVVVGYPARGIAVLDACYGDLRRYYRLERSSNLATIVWDSPPGYTNIPGIERMIYYTNTSPANAGFYRAGVTLR